MSFAVTGYGLPKNFGNLAPMSDSATPDLRRLADRVRSRRERLGLRQDEMAGRGGPSTTTLTKVENATPPPPAPATLRKLDASLGWVAGSAHQILYESKEPTLVSGESDPAIDRAHYYLTHQPERLRRNFLHTEDGFRRASTLWFDIQNAFDLAVRAVELGATVDAAREYLQSAFALAMTSGIAGQLSRDRSYMDEATRRFTEAMTRVTTIVTTPEREPDYDLEAAEKSRASRAEDQKNALLAAGVLRGDDKADDLTLPDQGSDVDSPGGDIVTTPDDYELAGRDTGGISEAEYIRRQQERDAELGEL